MATSATEIRLPETKRHPTEKMKCLAWYGKEDMRVIEKYRPIVTDPRDAIIRVTATSICGSDLHLYHGEFPEMTQGDVLGHESMGIVHEIGEAVKDFKVGDRVVVSFCIACGECEYCKKGFFSSCDRTNPSQSMEEAFGHRLAGIFGYSGLTGSYEGGQAEFLRVPLADNNLLRIPDDVPDEKALYLSDIVLTGWHANECAKVGEGDVVAIWGLGPVGLMAAKWAQFRGAKRVIGIEPLLYRRHFASQKLGIETIDADVSSKEVVRKLFEMVPGGPDCCIEAAGFRFPKSWLHKFQRTLMMETDTPEILREMIMSVKKNGRIGIVGDYFMNANQFPIGMFMEKGLTMSAGQTPCQRYWKQLLEYIRKGDFDPSFVITHRAYLAEGDRCYKIFDHKEDHCIKYFIVPKKAEESV